MTKEHSKDTQADSAGNAEETFDTPASAQPDAEQAKAAEPLTDEEKRRRLEALARNADRFFWQLAGLDIRRNGGENNGE